MKKMWYGQKPQNKRTSGPWLEIVLSTAVSKVKNELSSFTKSAQNNGKKLHNKQASGPWMETV